MPKHQMSCLDEASRSSVKMFVLKFLLAFQRFYMYSEQIAIMLNLLKKEVVYLKGKGVSGRIRKTESGLIGKVESPLGKDNINFSHAEFLKIEIRWLRYFELLTTLSNIKLAINSRPLTYIKLV